MRPKKQLLLICHDDSEAGALRLTLWAHGYDVHATSTAAWDEEVHLALLEGHPAIRAVIIHEKSVGHEPALALADRIHARGQRMPILFLGAREMYTMHGDRVITDRKDRGPMLAAVELLSGIRRGPKPGAARLKPLPAGGLS